MKVTLILILSAILLAPTLAADRVSREQAIQTATRFLQHYHQDVRSLRVHAWPKWGDFDEEYNRQIRLRLSHRKYWFVLFTPCDPNVYGGAQKIYVAMDTAEILGWGGER